MKKILLLYCLGFLYCCNNIDNIGRKAIVFSDRKIAFNVNEFITDIAYIPLKTDSSFLLKYIWSLQVQDSVLLVSTKKQNSIFLYSEGGDPLKKIIMVSVLIEASP